MPRQSPAPTPDELAWDPSRALGLWDETRTFEELCANIRALDRDKAIFWAARLNLLRWRCLIDPAQSFDELAPIFFTGPEIKAMVKALKRARRPREDFLAMFDRRSLLEILRWAALVGETHSTDEPRLSFAEARHFFAAARCARVHPLQRAIVEHAEPYLASCGPGATPPEFGLPVFRDLWALNSVTDHRDRLIGRSAVLLRQEFFGKAPELRALLEEITGLGLDQYLGSVLHVARCLASDLSLKSADEVAGYGLVGPRMLAPVAPNGRDVLERFLALESQTVSALRTGLLRRVGQDRIDQRTPFDTASLRSRPFVKHDRTESTILTDVNFLEDKLWIGPVFHLLAKGSAKAVFGAFGSAVERYVALLFQSLFARADKGEYDRLLLNPHGTAGPDRKELTDVCLRSGGTLLMVEAKAVTLPEQLQWFHGDAAYRRAIEERLASSGSGAKGVGQLARSIHELAHAKIRPDDPDMFAGVDRVMPVLLVHDTDISAPMHSPFIAKRFVELLGDLEGAELKRADGKLRIGHVETYLPTLMTLSDLEVLEGFYFRGSLASLIDSYYRQDEDRVTSLTTLFELVAKAMPRGPLDNGSILAKEGKAMVSKLEEMFSSRDRSP